MRIVILIAVLLGSSLNARDLPVPPDKGWKHAASGLILLPKLDGLARIKLIDATDGEYDVVADFRGADGATDATVYVFRPAIDDVAMWFERSQTQIEARESFGGVIPMSADAIAFAPPGGSLNSALRRTYTPERGPESATALAVMPLGSWLVVVRLSSNVDTSAAVDRRLDAVIAAMRWPTQQADAPAAKPIPDCIDPLHFEKAKVTRSTGADTLLTLMMGTVTVDPSTKKADAKPITWCRDVASRPAFGIYRNADAGSLEGYEIALNDAGRVMHVTPSLDTMLGKAHSYSVSFTSVDGSTDVFPSFDRLPRPEQVIALLGEKSAGSIRKDGEKTNVILPPSFK